MFSNPALTVTSFLMNWKNSTLYWIRLWRKWTFCFRTALSITAGILQSKQENKQAKSKLTCSTERTCPLHQIHFILIYQFHGVTVPRYLRLFLMIFWHLEKFLMTFISPGQSNGRRNSNVVLDNPVSYRSQRKPLENKKKSAKKVALHLSNNRMAHST